MRTIALFSFANEIHALTVQRALERRRGVRSCIVEASTLSKAGHLAWRCDAAGTVLETRLRCRGGGRIDVRDVDAVWWRRVNEPQELPAVLSGRIEADLINNECKSGLFGLVASAFRGQWVNDPRHSLWADSKPVQLLAASRARLRVPRTLVSQHPPAIRRFCREIGGRVIIKSLRGTRRQALAAVAVNLKDLPGDDSLRMCPAIYQEPIPGSRHLRVHAFGDDLHAVLIESPELDWRRNLSVPFQAWQLDKRLANRIRSLVAALGLRMGIVDLKLTPEGEPVFLELNPQGQFLFAQGLSGYDLVTPFADFLVGEAVTGSRMRAGA